MRRPATRISAARATALRGALEQLEPPPRDTRDPITQVRRYSEPADIEIAAVFAGLLSFGRVSSFMPVVTQLLDHTDTMGGPHAWVMAGAPALPPLRYRWVRTDDLQQLGRSLQQVLDQHGALATLATGPESDIAPGIERLSGALLRAAGPNPSRGLRHLLPRPSGGSACKRWCMLFRWMSRTQAPDLGIWEMPAERLVIPLDTHVHRIARLLGLTRRADASWRTAREITDNLARIYPRDPVSADFVLAHLGISGRCPRTPDQAACAACPLRAVCLGALGRARTEPTKRSRAAAGESGERTIPEEGAW